MCIMSYRVTHPWQSCHTLSHWSHVTSTYVSRVYVLFRRPAGLRVCRRPCRVNHASDVVPGGGIAMVFALPDRPAVSPPSACPRVLFACPVRLRLVPFLPWNPRWRNALAPSVDPAPVNACCTVIVHYVLLEVPSICMIDFYPICLRA